MLDLLGHGNRGKVVEYRGVRGSAPLLRRVGAEQKEPTGAPAKGAAVTVALPPNREGILRR